VSKPGRSQSKPHLTIRSPRNQREFPQSQRSKANETPQSPEALGPGPRPQPKTFSPKARRTALAPKRGGLRIHPEGQGGVTMQRTEWDRKCWQGEFVPSRGGCVEARRGSKLPYTGTLTKTASLPDAYGGAGGSMTRAGCLDWGLRPHCDPPISGRYPSAPVGRNPAIYKGSRRTEI